MTLAQLIRHKRISLGMTLEEVADAAGTTKSHMHAIESGAVPNPGILMCARIALVLGLNVQQMAAAAIAQAMIKQESER